MRTEGVRLARGGLDGTEPPPAALDGPGTGPLIKTACNRAVNRQCSLAEYGRHGPLIHPGAPSSAPVFAALPLVLARAYTAGFDSETRLSALGPVQSSESTRYRKARFSSCLGMLREMRLQQERVPPSRGPPALISHPSAKGHPRWLTHCLLCRSQNAKGAGGLSLGGPGYMIPVPLLHRVWMATIACCVLRVVPPSPPELSPSACV
jgi:hypothetical protein